MGEAPMRWYIVSTLIRRPDGMQISHRMVARGDSTADAMREARDEMTVLFGPCFVVYQSGRPDLSRWS